MSRQGQYELVPSTDDPNAPLPQQKGKTSLLTSRKTRLACLAVVVVVLLTAVYRYWFGDSALEEGHHTDQDSKQGAFTSSTTSGLSSIPTHRPSEGSDKGGGETMSNGKYSVGYFVNWAIYGRKFPPQKIPAEDLTHILYAFANVRPDSGVVHITDSWADTDIHYPGDSWDEPGKNLYGNFKALYKLKKEHRHLKTLLSIGGWTYSPNFHPVVVSEVARRNFVESSVKLMEDLGLDGLDIDYEYPSNQFQAIGYATLLKELREELDRRSEVRGTDHRFLLSIAAPCGPQNYKMLHIEDMVESLDFWNLMAYDYAGSWGSVADHQANVHGGAINTQDAVEWYMSHGVPRHKIVIGIPLYGRSFMNTEGPGASFSGVGSGSWEAGVYDYRALPLPGAYLLQDENAMASWTMDYQKHEMISFDSEEVGRWKGEWIKNQGFGGSMFWELSGDKNGDRDGMEGGEGKDPQPGNSLVKAVNEAMGELDTSPNWLSYEYSQFENMRDGMP